MTNEEREKALEVWYDLHFDDARIDEARRISIQALEAQRWIPVSERLPSEVGDYLVTYRDDLDELWVDSDLYFASRESFCCYDVIAWMPLPQPYKAESEDKE